MVPAIAMAKVMMVLFVVFLTEANGKPAGNLIENKIKKINVLLDHIDNLILDRRQLGLFPFLKPDMYINYSSKTVLEKKKMLEERIEALKNKIADDETLIQWESK